MALEFEHEISLDLQRSIRKIGFGQSRRKQQSVEKSLSEVVTLYRYLLRWLTRATEARDYKH